MRTERFLACAMLLLAAAVPLAWADWPQFQGPDRNGISSETGLAQKWPAGGPKVLWTLRLGPGFASPAIKDGKVYILDRPSGQGDVLLCLDLNTGKELWKCAYDAPGKVALNGSRSTPTIDDKHVYVVGVLGDFHCISLETHQVVWRKHLVKDFQARLPRWGVSQSPSLYKNLVIVAPQGRAVGVAAFDRDTGEVVWKTKALPGGQSYVSPVVTQIGGVATVMSTSATPRRRRRRAGRAPRPTVKGQVVGMAADTGKILWTYDGWGCSIPISYPTTIGDGRLFVTGEYGAGSAMIKLEQAGGQFTVEELYTTQECGAQIHQPILHKGHLYMISNGNKRRDGLVCLALDGTVKWRTKDIEGAPNFERGGIMLADGMLYVIEGQKGTLHLVEPSPEGYKEVSRVKLLEGKQMWAPMALSDGKLLLRDQRQLKCLDLRNP